jgi:cyclophilin family peptidyl-prolyl cis-trans isomerase
VSKKRPIPVKEVPRTELIGEKSWWSQPGNVMLVVVLAVLTIVGIAASWQFMGPITNSPDQPATADAPGGVASANCGGQVLMGVLPEPTGDSNGRPQWEQSFPMLIDTNCDYRATISTSKGDILVDLYEKDAPNTVNNFVALSESGFYNGITFHRVIDGFMAQGGDPTGTGTGGPGYSFPDEFSPNLSHSQPGILSMANSGANTNGSQFFITYVETPHLDAYENGVAKPCGQPGISCHAVFGVVTEGLAPLQSLNKVQPGQGAGANPDVINSIVITVQ